MLASDTWKKEPMLEKMLEMQRELQVKHYGAAPDTLEGKERIQFVKDMHIALTDELHEALAEVSWKPWAKAEYFNEAAYKGELVDAFHFFMNLMMAGHITAEDLFEGYVKKNALNAKRQIEGYDGVSTKCPGCGRALDDEAVKCTKTRCSISLDAYQQRKHQNLGTPVDAQAYDEPVGEVTGMTSEEKAELYGQMYGKPPKVMFAPAGTPLDSFFDPVKPMRRPSGRISSVEIHTTEPLTPEALNSVKRKTAEGLPNRFDRRYFQ